MFGVGCQIAETRRKRRDAGAPFGRCGQMRAPIGLCVIVLAGCSTNHRDFPYAVPATSRQVVVVRTVKSPSQVNLSTWRRTGDMWFPGVGPFLGVVGKRGIAA